MSPGVALDGKRLQPGTNALHFRVRPLKCGLYCIKGVQARLGRLRLALPLVQSDDETQAAATAGAKQPSRGGADGIGIGTEFYCTAVFSYQSAHEPLSVRLDALEMFLQQPMLRSVHRM